MNFSSGVAIRLGPDGDLPLAGSKGVLVGQRQDGYTAIAFATSDVQNRPMRFLLKEHVESEGPVAAWWMFNTMQEVTALGVGGG